MTTETSNARGEVVAWFPTNAQGEIIRNYGDGSPVYACKTKEEAEQASRCHLGATGPVIPLYAAPPPAAARVDVRGLVTLAEQWERDAGGCRRDGYMDAAVVKEDCAFRLRQALGISAIAEALAAEGVQAGDAEAKTVPVPTRVYLIGETAVIVGAPQRGWDEDAQDAHNCDAMGCATIGPHVLARVPFTDERALPTQQGGGEINMDVTVRDGAWVGTYAEWCRRKQDAPPSAPVGVEGLARLLERIRDLLASLPVDCLGSGTDASGQPYPIRDEVIRGITKALAQQPAADPRSTHRVWRGDDWLPCYCEATDDHRIGSEQPAAVDEAYPTPRNRAEAVALARLALAYLGVIDAHIDAAVARCETDLAQHQEPTT